MVSIPLIWNVYKENIKGVRFGILMNRFEKNFKGFLIGGGNEIEGDSEGIDIAWFINGIGNYSKGINIAGVGNYCKKVDKYLIQIGGLANVVDYIKEKDFALQIGGVNRIGKRIWPFINIYGVKNLLKIFKNSNKKNLEGKLK